VTLSHLEHHISTPAIFMHRLNVHYENIRQLCLTKLQYRIKHISVFSPLMSRCFDINVRVLNEGKNAAAANNSTEQSPSLQADDSLTCREITCLLWIQKVHYRVHNSLPVELLLRIHLQFFKIRFNIIFPPTPISPKQVIPFRYFVYISAVFPIIRFFISFHLMTLIIQVFEEYKLWSSSLCSLL